MSVKRTRDPAGLLPDHAHVDLTNPQPGDLDAFWGIMRSLSPASRIEQLRRHPELVTVADALAARIADVRAKRNLDNTKSAEVRALDNDIKSAEFWALYFAATPAAIEKRRRKLAQRKNVTDQAIHDALKTHRTQLDAATSLGIDERQIRNRMPRAERERIRKENRKR